MQLPNQWLWDMVDEFVYQFQSFCQYRAKMKNKTEQEIALLRQYDQVFFCRCSLGKIVDVWSGLVWLLGMCGKERKK